MSFIKMTVRQCKDLGLWDRYCKWSNINPYAVNEGLIYYDDTIEFDSEFKKDDGMSLEEWEGVEIGTKIQYKDNDETKYGYFAGVFKTTDSIICSCIKEDDEFSGARMDSYGACRYVNYNKVKLYEEDSKKEM